MGRMQRVWIQVGREGQMADATLAISTAAELLTFYKARIAAIHEPECALARTRGATCDCTPYFVDNRAGEPG